MNTMFMLRLRWWYLRDYKIMVQTLIEIINFKPVLINYKHMPVTAHSVLMCQIAPQQF